MAEAEDVITDAARHATVYLRARWEAKRAASRGPAPPGLAELKPRLDLLICGVFGRRFPLFAANPPAPPTALARMLHRDGPRAGTALPATDGNRIWLPASLDLQGFTAIPDTYRTLALQQAMRALRGSVRLQPELSSCLLRDLFLLLEAHAADRALAELLPGMGASIDCLRRHALSLRPPLGRFPAWRRPLEGFTRLLMARSCRSRDPDEFACASAAGSLSLAKVLARDLHGGSDAPRHARRWLLPDLWTGELRPPESGG